MDTPDNTMAVYSPTEKKSILDSVTITGILRYYGKPSTVNRSGLCLSPFRDENSPSFHITPDDGGWIDFGSGDSGGKLDLVSMLSGCSKADAYDRLAEISKTFIPEPKPQLARSRERRMEYVTIIDSVGMLDDKTLLEYSRSRGIDDRYMKKYCRQIRYHVGPMPTGDPVIGFQNINGGWVFRSPLIKKCSSGGISLVEMEKGQPTAMVAVFEGFFDFLSYVQDHGGKVCDAVVLNGVGNTNASIDYLKSYDIVKLYLDNDQAGKEAASHIIKALGSDKHIIYKADAFGPFKDYNEMLMNRIKNQPNNTVQWKQQFHKR